MPNIPPISSNIIEMLARFCGEINVGSEISMLLLQPRLTDPDTQIAKWKYLYNAFATFQNRHNAADHIIPYVRLALDSARYTNSRDLYLTHIGEVNPILAFIGLEFREDGKMHRVDNAKTLSEAALRAQRLRILLEQRNVHGATICYVRPDEFHRAFSFSPTKAFCPGFVSRNRYFTQISCRNKPNLTLPCSPSPAAPEISSARSSLRADGGRRFF